MSSVIFVVAFMLIAAASAGMALVAARVCRIDCLVACLFGPTPMSLPGLVRQLGEVADIAKSQGMLVAERSADIQNDPILRAGISLAIEGRSAAEIRQQLTDDADRSHRGRLGLSLPRLLQITSISFLSGLLLIVLTGSASAGWMTFPVALAAWFTLCAGMVGLAVAGAAADHAFPADVRLATSMRIEAAVLISSGQHGRAVRAALDEMLPATSSAPLARAA